MQQETTFTIGRAADNRLVIDKPGVSRKHARVTFVTDNVVLLEDLDSTYGTVVDGWRIARTIISPDSRIGLGPEVLDPQRIFAVRHPVVAAQPMLMPDPLVAAQPMLMPAVPDADGLDIPRAFRRLEHVYDIYMEARESLLVKGPVRQAWVRGSIGLAPVVGAVTLGLVGGGIGFIPLIAGAVGQILAAHFINIPEKLSALDKEFKRSYVCPRCGEFLGNVPYAELLKRRQCRECKAKWVD